MSKKSLLLSGMVVLLLVLPMFGDSSLPTDSILLNYPLGYTKVLVADLKFFANQDLYKTAILQPLRAARHPLNGILQAVELFRLDVNTLAYVAHGAGANLTSFSMLEGAPFPATFGALQGLRAAVGAPNSPYQNWDLVNTQGIPVVYTGGTFGPIKIQWAYVLLQNRLFMGTETGLGGDPNVAQLKSSAERIAARQMGQIAYFDEFPAALASRAGQVSFVRKTDPAKDLPIEPGEEAMSFAIAINGNEALVTFFIRFQTTEQAALALNHLQEGNSSYLAQDFYLGKLISAQQNNRFLTFAVATGLRGIVGLLIATMPF